MAKWNWIWLVVFAVVIVTNLSDAHAGIMWNQCVSPSTLTVVKDGKVLRSEGMMPGKTKIEILERRPFKIVYEMCTLEVGGHDFIYFKEFITYEVISIEIDGFKFVENFMCSEGFEESLSYNPCVKGSQKRLEERLLSTKD